MNGCVESGKLHITFVYDKFSTWVNLTPGHFHMALKDGKLDIIKWLHNVKCQTNEYTYRFIDKVKDENILLWLTSNGYL
ncbi:Hypothetical protein ORPV_105 [Orpheovirus IHUMI-LCC2]|uniref:Uncharacterized protein n=1 Tax=Orpheovirus IHUMI-LCC2 TaxID=2023057 RepID=A0A2I2L3G3_9VIRU|nr:Hypothetical protein ORPV_105 [Orpheovirus IHUMI-LCC2]SNW62009.1 Hypothetical protein ORPV_105 [Orpheovirus IHUMI-LCC2]